MSKFRFQHSFQYKQYHSITFEAELNIEDVDQIDPLTETLQQAYGELMLKMFQRYKENAKDGELQAYINALLPNEVMIAVRSNPILLDSLLLAAKARLEKEAGNE